MHGFKGRGHIRATAKDIAAGVGILQLCDVVLGTIDGDNAAIAVGLRGVGCRGG